MRYFVKIQICRINLENCTFTKTEKRRTDSFVSKIHSYTYFCVMILIRHKKIFFKFSFCVMKLWKGRLFSWLTKAMPSLRDAAHDGVLCTFSNRSAPDRGKWCGPSGQLAMDRPSRTKSHPAGSLSSSQPCWASPLAFGLIVHNSMATGVKINKRLPSLRSADLLDQIFQVI